MKDFFQKPINFFFILLIPLFLFIPLSFLNAIQTGTVGIEPALSHGSYFFYKLDKGESKEDAVRVTNHADQKIALKIYPVDAATTNDGNFAPRPEYYPQKEIGQWVKLSADLVELKPHETKEIPFIITIPSDADVGDHMGAIVIQAAKPKGKAGGGTGVNIVTRVAVRITRPYPGRL